MTEALEEAAAKSAEPTRNDASPTPGSPGTSSVRVELPNRAKLSTLVAHHALYWTARQAIGAAATVGDLSPVKPKWAFYVSSYTDAPAAILVPSRGTSRRMVHFDKFRAEWLWDKQIEEPLERQDSAILYFHGGGYVSCGLNTHRRFVAKIGRASGMPVFNVDYRQLAGAHFIETLADAVEAYEYLLAQGFAGERIILSGDSAGGGLAFRLALACKERALPMPCGISTIAPWADLDWTTRNAHPNGPHCSVLPPIGLEVVSRWCYTINGELDPMWSAVNHDMTGMPPAMIQVGSLESLMADAEQLARRYDEANVPMRLQIWDHAPHVHQAGSDLLADARAAIRQMGDFNRQAIGEQAQPRMSTLRRLTRRSSAA